MRQVYSAVRTVHCLLPTLPPPASTSAGPAVPSHKPEARQHQECDEAIVQYSTVHCCDAWHADLEKVNRAGTPIAGREFTLWRVPVQRDKNCPHSSTWTTLPPLNSAMYSHVSPVSLAYLKQVEQGPAPSRRAVAELLEPVGGADSHHLIP